ncbi:poly polymerase, catalytic region domain-containing protein [Reticulomyxa filosa]|uniref:Poly polymerase, catalytic region domain-containing protein n=1 Tax=Reticulomyxa filosa TaxID=46433 RepID=X6N9B3_RETFI|nr:poly polymerase, catalytic region domain-containing protein [Reticulomyxa filosa]|eukprot:ETO22503.1 poly polymerase, catalytic region domain-containing protein [Reticulomyxa filosa]
MQYNNIVKIERVEHPYLWRKYSDYSLTLGPQLSEKRVHHGTRANQPQLIYSTGFDLAKARVGGCLWFAVNSSYSRGGFQFSLNDGTYQIFVSLVASGNPNDVKFISNGVVLNVYKNEATYPGYLVTYR